jgi:hypothetical protein
MDADTVIVYERLYQDYGNDLRDEYQRYLAFRIRDILNRVIGELNAHTLRPDGKFFLLLNFHQMVATPMLSDFSPRRKTEEELFNYIEQDASGILRTCMDISPEEISSHVVLSATDQFWENTRTFVEQYW